MSQAIVQIIAVVAINLRSAPRRAGASVVGLVGIAGVVVVFVSILAVAEGFHSTMREAADPQVAIVMRLGSGDEMSSTLTRDHVQIVKHQPGVLRQGDEPAASAELLTMVSLPRRSTGTDANIALRGVEPQAFAVRRGLRIREGRRFEPGQHEILAGLAASRQFGGIGIGQRLTWGTDTWTVVGTFEADGSAVESELWCDLAILQAAIRQTGLVRSVRVRLESPESFARFETAATSDPRVTVGVVREPEYYAEQSTATARLVTTLGVAIAGLMAIGAVFGAVNTMYTVVAARTREIATLRALGFGPAPVVVSVLIESALLAAAGGAVGAAGAWALFDGYQTATLNWQSFSQVAFAFDVTPAVAAKGMLAALAIGVLGGLLPAWHAAHMPIVVGLRAP